MSKGKARIFVPLTKVDEEKRLVYGTISHEILDKSGEVMDYDTSKPLFEEWSGGIEKSTGGLSKGNVRVMHGLSACGKLTELNFDDVAKSIDVAAKIVDDNEWEKVIEGVYTGFSVGGSYEKKWTETIDGQKVKKYTAKPMEVSIVDNPCVPTATFSMFKADGAVEEIEFKVEHDKDEWPEVETVQKSVVIDQGPEVEDTPDETPEEKAARLQAAEPKTAAESAVVGDPSLQEAGPSNEEVAAKATQLAKDAGHDRWVEFIEQARTELTKVDPTAGGHNPLKEDPTAKKPKIEGKTAAEHADVVQGSADGVEAHGGTTGADNPARRKQAAKTTPASIKQVWEASDGKTFDKKAECEAHEEELAKSDQRDHGDEDPNIDKEVEQAELPLADQLKKALEQVAETLDQAEAARSEGDEDAPLPLMADFDRLGKAVAHIEQDNEEVLQKSVYAVSRFAEVLSSLAHLVTSVKSHSDADSGLPDEVKAAVTALSSTFQTFATEQVAKLIANLDDPKCEYYYCAAKADDADALAKDVAELIDTVKEPAAAIRDTLLKAAGPDDEEDETEGANDLQKVTAERDSLAKVAQEAIEQLPLLKARIETLENTPLPRAPRNIVEKDGGNGLLKGTTDTERLAEMASLVQLHGADGLATLMIKAAQATGGKPLSPVV